MTFPLMLLGALLCSLTVSSEVVPQADFDVQGIAGKWYLLGFATNTEWFVNRRASMKMGTAMLTITADGELDFSYTSLNSDGSCWRLNNVAKKTDVPGKFTYTSLGEMKDMCMVDVKYDEYALIHTMKSKGSNATVVNKLYGRAMDLSADLLEKFRQFSLETGILPENIAFLPKNAECPAA
ncbi:lipocalin [Anarrhichthys ocellatus]|uniref:lipocalin n=1 Tax=Anarrhichthys ocellatus TaxID=433405 RepID=UPI0012EEA0E7|nr:lipocalin-like [Anarrhichthys ocellatus]